MPLDFAVLELTPKPNQYLVCPPGICAKAQTVHREAPVYPATVDKVVEAFMGILAKQPRITAGPVDTALRQYEIVQRSAIFRFPDTVTIRFIPLDGDRTTVAIYSRSHYGYSDMGVNKKRIDTWLDALEREVATAAPAAATNPGY